MSRKQPQQPSHPVAGASGTGPPVAPLDWRWKCGQRLRDMYFYTPGGKLIRSKVELASFLGTLPDGPSPSDFCWRVTADIINSGVWNKEEEEQPTKTSKPRLGNGGRKRKQIVSEEPRPGNGGRKRKQILSEEPRPGNGSRKRKQIVPEEPRPGNGSRKRKQIVSEEPRPGNGSRKRKQIASEESDSALPAQMVHKRNKEGEVHIAQVKPLAMRDPGTVISKKDAPVTPPPARSKVKARKKKSISDATAGHPSFKEILGENSSFMWLKNEDTMEAFIQEARILDELPAELVRELRDVLVARNLQVTNLVKYSNNVLRIFARILGGLGEEQSVSFGKVELAALCVNLSRRPQPPILCPEPLGVRAGADCNGEGKACR